MSRLLALLAITLGLVGGTPVRAQTPSVVQLEATLPSPALGRDLGFALYLPPGYAEGHERLPVVYLLHGVDGVGRHWLTEGYARETTDKLIREGRIRPMILVMPDAGNSWYVDSADVGGPGNYATAISHDLVDWIDHHYRTRPDRGGRGIAGISMGGFGAFRLAFLHPDEYGAAAALSGAFWSRVTPDMEVSPRMGQIFNGAFGTPLSTARFLRDAPMPLMARLQGASDPPAFYLTAGNQDRFRLYAETALFKDKLAGMGVPVEAAYGDGDHDWSFWMKAIGGTLEFFDRRFGAATRTAAKAPRS